MSDPDQYYDALRDAELEELDRQGITCEHCGERYLPRRYPGDRFTGEEIEVDCPRCGTSPGEMQDAACEG